MTTRTKSTLCSEFSGVSALEQPEYAVGKTNLDEVLHGVIATDLAQIADKSELIEALLTAIEQIEVISDEQETKAMECFRMCSIPYINIIRNI